MAVVVGLTLLAVAGYSFFNERDWRTAASVNGTSISRASLRDRVLVIEALQALAGLRAGPTGPAQASAITAAFAGDPVVVARSQLVDEVLLGPEADRLGIRVAEADVDAELAHAINSPASIEVRWLRLRASGRAAADVAAVVAGTTAQIGQAAEPDVSAIAGGLSPSWQALSGDAWISSDGPAAPSPEAPIPDLIVAARAAASGVVLPTIDDGLGHLIVARVTAVNPGLTVGAALRTSATSRGASDGALEAWARGQVLRRAVASALSAGADNQPVAQVRLRELPLGAATPGPAMVELSVLTVQRLAPSDAAVQARTIAGELAELTPHDRAQRFRDLAQEANGGGPPTTVDRSGEIGWFARDGLMAAVGDAAFTGPARPGDVLGPITTSAGPQLFLLEARYGGTLDDRAAAIATQANQPGADFAALASTVVPADDARAQGGPWRLLDEFDPAQFSDSGLPAANPGDTVGPIDVAGEAIMAQVLERRTAAPNERQRVVIQLTALDHWLAQALAKAQIVFADDPLGLATPAASGEPPATVRPQGGSSGSVQVPPFGLPTPFLPTPP